MRMCNISSSNSHRERKRDKAKRDETKMSDAQEGRKRTPRQKQNNNQCSVGKSISMICTIVAASERVPIVIQPSHHRKKYCLPEFIFPGMSIVLFWGGFNYAAWELSIVCWPQINRELSLALSLARFTRQTVTRTRRQRQQQPKSFFFRGIIYPNECLRPCVG